MLNSNGYWFMTVVLLVPGGICSLHISWKQLYAYSGYFLKIYMWFIYRFILFVEVSLFCLVIVQSGLKSGIGPS